MFVILDFESRKDWHNLPYTTRYTMSHYKDFSCCIYHKIKTEKKLSKEKKALFGWALKF